MEEKLKVTEKALKELGYMPKAFQIETITHLLNGSDVFLSQSTGKNINFLFILQLGKTEQ